VLIIPELSDFCGDKRLNRSTRFIPIYFYFLSGFLQLDLQKIGGRLIFAD